MDNTRLFLFAALVFVGMLLWQQWQADYGPQPVTSSEVATGAQPAGGEEAQIPTADLPDAGGTSGSVISASPEGTGQAGAAAMPTSQLVQVDTDVIQALIDTRGGVIRSLKLKQYPTSLDQPDDWLELAHTDSDSVYILQSGLISPIDGMVMPNHTSDFRVDSLRFELVDGEQELLVPLHWQQDGIEVVKTYRFNRGDYLIGVDHRVTNNSGQDWKGKQYRQIQRSRPLETSRLLYTYTGSVYYNEAEKYEKVSFDNMEEQALKLESDGGWIAMIQHYFLSAWVPDQEEVNDIYTLANLKRSPSTYTIGMRSRDLQLIPPGATGEFSSQLFVGPKIVNRLEEIAPGLELTVDYGWLTFLSKPLYWLLSWYHSFVGNWGVAIILLTLTVKGAFYKLSETSYKSMAKMRKVSPR